MRTNADPATGALHLHPITRVLQFRTALTYLDDFDTKNRRGTRAEEEEEKKKAAAAPRKDMPKSLVSHAV